MGSGISKSENTELEKDWSLVSYHLETPEAQTLSIQEGRFLVTHKFPKVEIQPTASKIPELIHSPFLSTRRSNGRNNTSSHPSGGGDDYDLD